MSTYTQWLAKQLYRANTGWCGERFYAVKDRVLRDHASMIGHDLQLFRGEECYRCNSRDPYTSSWRKEMLEIEGWSPELNDCSKCGGNGWYKMPAYVVLERWIFHGHVFHRPLARPKCYEEGPLEIPHRLIIHGLIEKRQHPRHWVATFFLFLLYDRGGALQLLLDRFSPFRRHRCNINNNFWRYSWLTEKVWDLRLYWRRIRKGPMSDDDLPF